MAPDFSDFPTFFKSATTNEPFPYQVRLTTEELPQILNVPTGAGKTDAVILAWLWKRRFADEKTRKTTPRRLVYCLPMRVLVEQTRDKAEEWLKNSGLFAGTPDAGNDKIAVTVLMGGEDKDEWDEHPERDAIIIGTQDMLLSRALNRGYGMSRYRWPMHYGLLNNDCFWVMDEVQLMGVGVETSAQMQAFRKKFGIAGNVKTTWMSATVGENQLDTVDHPKPKDGFLTINLDKDDLSHQVLADRFNARKKISKCQITSLNKKADEKNYAGLIAGLLLQKRKPGTLVLCVLNSVKRAQEIYRTLEDLITEKGLAEEVKTSVIHSRFRQNDRQTKTDFLLKKPEGDKLCRIVVSTQVVEAGVDVSAHVLITELAPWPSMVQRFGRCNRYGEYSNASIEWIDVIPDDEEKASSPYDRSELEQSRKLLEGLEDASLEILKKKSAGYAPPRVTRQVIRKKDVLDLFDTTPDLTGNDLDVSRFIRDGADMDVSVFWRDVPDGPDKDLDERPHPAREEICPVSISGINEFAKKKGFRGWVWKPLEGEWHAHGEKKDKPRFRPGQVILLDLQTGGYDKNIGWTGEYADIPNLDIIKDKTISSEEKQDNDETRSFIGRGEPLSLTKHTDDVVEEAANLSGQMGLTDNEKETLVTAALWHDYGKAHDAFQNAIAEHIPNEKKASGVFWAKSGTKSGRLDCHVMMNGRKIKRSHFRHELASAMAWLQNDGKTRTDANLVAYMIAAHHGKIRVSIRSLPQEIRPNEDILFARGVWQKDKLPPIPGITPHETMLDLSPIQLGKGSWLERTLGLLEDPDMGPFRLAHHEMLLRIADWRASAKEAGK